MRTARLLTVSCSAQEVCPTPLDADPPPMQNSSGCRPPWMQTTPWMQTIPPWMKTTLVMWPVMHAGKPRPPWTEWMTHRCKNITLPQTSFPGGNKKAFQKDAYRPLVDRWGERCCRGGGAVLGGAGAVHNRKWHHSTSLPLWTDRQV